MRMMLFGIIIIVAVALLVRRMNVRYNMRQSCKRKDAISKYNIMDEKVSYDRYKKVAHKTSVRNTPVRTQGDFWDFILPCLRNPSKKYLEDRLSCIDCGDENK